MIIVHEAPSFFSHDFFAYLLLQRIVADRPENPFELEMMKSKKYLKKILSVLSIKKRWQEKITLAPKKDFLVLIGIQVYMEITFK